MLLDNGVEAVNVQHSRGTFHCSISVDERCYVCVLWITAHVGIEVLSQLIR